MTLERPQQAAGGWACPDAQRLAEYADQLLTAPEQESIERHLVGCAECREALFIAAAFRAEDERQPVGEDSRHKVLWFRQRWVKVSAGVLAAAAAALVLLTYAGLVPPLPIDRDTPSPELAGLFAAVRAAPARPTDGRLTGGLPYGPPPSVTRGVSGSANVSPEIQIAAASLELKIGERQSARDFHALGVASLMLGDLDGAQRRLVQAAAAAPSNAAFASDLAAAHLARGLRTGNEADLLLAIAAADRALQLDASLNEARFNRALALASRPRPDLSGLQDYAARDAGPWGDEARSRLAALQPASGR